MLGPIEQTDRPALELALGTPGGSWRAGALEIDYFAPVQELSYAVLATSGALRRPEGALILSREPLAADLESLVGLLVEYARYRPASGGLDFGDVIPAVDCLAPLCEMEALLLAPPIPIVRSAAGQPIPRRARHAWLLPLFMTEARYAIAAGISALMARFALERVDPTDLGRRRLIGVTHAEPTLLRGGSAELPSAKFEALVGLGEIEIRRRSAQRGLS